MKSELIEGILAQNKQFIAKAISLIENQPNSENFLNQLFPKKNQSYRIGITGPPGAGKSSLVNNIISFFRKNNLSVGVIGVDPTSPFTGGALLGDRIRMVNHYSDDKVFIRSMASRGNHGGLSSKTLEAGEILECAGFDIIIYETVGVGQVELDIVQMADSIIVVLVPESGDDIQMMKAGLMEIADIFVINKSDRPNANQLESILLNILSTIELNSNSWKPHLVKTVANQSKGIKKLYDSIQDHKNYINNNGINLKKSDQRYKKRIFNLIAKYHKDSFWKASNIERLECELKKKFDRRLSPYEFAKKMLDNED